MSDGFVVGLAHVTSNILFKTYSRLVENNIHRKELSIVPRWLLQ